MFIIDDLLFWLPVKGVTSIAKRVKEMADQERGMREKWSEDILKNEMRFRAGRITLKEFQKNQKEFLKKLKGSEE